MRLLKKKKDILNFHQSQLYFQCFPNDYSGYKTRRSQEYVCNTETLMIHTKPNFYPKNPLNVYILVLALSDL